MTTEAAPTMITDRTNAHEGVELTPAIAAMGSLVVIAFPLVYLLIQAVEAWSGSAPGMDRSDPFYAAALLTVAAALLAVPALIATAVAKSSRGLMTLAIVWTSAVALVYCLCSGLI